MEKARKDEQKMNQKQIIGAVVAAGLFIVTGVSSVLTNTLSERMLADTAKKTEDALLGGNTTTLPGEPYIGIVAVEGTIQEQTSSNGIFDTVAGYQHDTTLDYIDRMMEDEKNQGILLRVDSPGGTVYESEEKKPDVRFGLTWSIMQRLAGIIFLHHPIRSMRIPIRQQGRLV